MSVIKRNQNSKKRSGFTLIEFIIVVALIGVGIVTVMNLYGGAKTTSQVNTETQNLQTSTAKIRAMFASRGGNYAGLNNTMAIASKAVPQSMVESPGNIRNSFGGAVTYQANGTSSFDVTYAQVPTAVCMELVPAVDGVYNRITVGGSIVKNPNTATDMLMMTTQCSSSDATTIVFNAI